MVLDRGLIVLWRLLEIARRRPVFVRMVQMQPNRIEVVCKRQIMSYPSSRIEAAASRLHEKLLVQLPKTPAHDLCAMVTDVNCGGLFQIPRF